jgi:predicted NAD/FAD-binding protein
LCKQRGPIGTDTSFARPDGDLVAACRGGRWWFDDRTGDRVPDDFEAEIERFRRRAPEVLDDGRFADWRLGRYLDHVAASAALRELWVLPRAQGAFPMPDRRAEDLPLRGLIEFWRVHGVVGTAPVDRRAVVGGMHRWPAAFARWFTALGGELCCSTRVTGVTRQRRGVTVRTVDRAGRNEQRRFDHVLLAGHPRQVRAMLPAPDAAEATALDRFQQQRARVVVHTDLAMHGGDPDALGAFHYVVRTGARPQVTPTITFFPNRLAGLPAMAPAVFVAMNPLVEPDPDRIVSEHWFVHPVAGPEQRRAATALDALQGRRRTWYAGSWLMSPFVHESAFTSGLRAAERLIASERGGRRTAFDLAIA